MRAIDVQAVLERVDLAALCEEAGARFDRRHASRCPLHPGADNPAAFHLYRTAGGPWRWHCFTRCQRKHNDGNAIDFYMLWKRVDFMTAYNDLSRRVGLDRQTRQDWHAAGSSRMGGLRAPARAAGPTFASPDSPSTLWQDRAASFVAYAREQLHGAAGPAVLAYLLEERALSPATVERWGLGYNPHDVFDDPVRWGQAGKPLWCPRGIVIPAWRGGRLHYVKVRRPAVPPQPVPHAAGRDALADAIGPATGLPGAKYVCLRGSATGLFGAEARAGHRCVLLAEGEFDAMLAWQEAGDLVDVLTLGSASNRPDAAAQMILMAARRLLIAYDADPAGAAGSARWLGRFPRAVQVVLPCAGSSRPKDLTEFARAGGHIRTWVSSLLG